MGENPEKTEQIERVPKSTAALKRFTADGFDCR
jgi:hypothetical protein